MREYQDGRPPRAPGSRPLLSDGQSLAPCGQSKAAIAAFEDACGLDPDDVQSLTFLGRIFASDEESANPQRDRSGCPA